VSGQTRDMLQAVLTKINDFGRMERLSALGRRVLVASRQDPQKNRLRGPGERFRTNGP